MTIMVDLRKSEPVRVETISWRYTRPQVWHDGWRNADRICRFVGECVVCGRRTFAFDDGQNDPRGVLGDHAADPLDPSEFDNRTAREVVPLCFPCANDYDRYQFAMRIADRRWDAEEEAGAE